MRILGISADYHDAGAVLLDDGIPVAMGQEERFSRIKHDPQFPKKSIDFVLAKSNCKSVDYVAFYEKPFIKFERFVFSTLSAFPFTSGLFRTGMLSWLKQKMWIKNEILDYLQVENENVFFIPHHLSHAAGSFLSSPYDEAGILTIDGVGEWTTTALGYGKENKISLQKEIRFPHSIGLLYSVFTGYLGFRVNDGEYKLMGLSPYGKPVYMDKIQRLVDVKEDGSYRLNLDYFSFQTSASMPYNRKFLNLFGEPRNPEMEHKFEQRHADIAASIQKFTEDIIIKLVNNIFQETKNENLCIAGGVGLNSVANYKILGATPIKNIYVQPASGDAGGALGAALYLYYSLMDNKREFILNAPYYGSDYTNSSIEEYLKSIKIDYEKFSDNERNSFIAESINEGKIIGLFQGRSEWGPRALGNRSIIADARRKEMLKTVNLSVKFRESFRPFAPSVLYEDADKLFNVPKDHYPSKFMLYVCPVSDSVKHQGSLPAITHVDGSARPQVVTDAINPRYFDILQKFKEISGVGCFLNTSFNLSGEPIVESPQNAYNSFMKSKMDLLVLENCVIKKV